MVLAAFVNLVLVALYLLLAYITFKELSNRQVEESTLQRILLKWMTAGVFFSSFWILESVLYFAPTSILKLPLGMWILMPQFYGEYAIFNLFSDVFEYLEFYFRYIRNSISSWMFGLTFSLCTFSIIKKFLPTDRLKYFQNELRKLDKEMNDELRLRKLIRRQMSGGSHSGYQTPGGHFDRTRDHRDTTIMNPDAARRPNKGGYYKPPSGQIYTPVGMFTRTPLVTNTNESIMEDEDDGSQGNTKQSRTSVKAGKHSRQTSKDANNRKSLKASGHNSSYIAPGLFNKKQGSSNKANMCFQEKRESSKKK